MNNPIMLSILFGVIPICVLLLFAFGKNRNEEEKAEDSTPADDNDAPEIEAVVSAKLVKKNRGGIWGLFGFILTLACWFVMTFVVPQEANLATAIISHSVKNPANLIGIATLLSFFGLCFHDASCILLSAVALVAAFMMDIGVFFVLLPAIILMISHVRMKKNVGLKVKTDSLH